MNRSPYLEQGDEFLCAVFAVNVVSSQSVGAVLLGVFIQSLGVDLPARDGSKRRKDETKKKLYPSGLIGGFDE